MKANQFQIYFRHLFAGLLVGLVAACSPMDNPSGLVASETPPLPAENTSTPTVITPTETPFVTSTPVVTPTVTKTPYPILTLTSSQKLEIMNYLEEKPGCPLPCWNGLTPGVSSSDEIQGFFARLGFDFGEWDSPDQAQAGERMIELQDFPKGTYSSTLLTLLVKWSKGLVDYIAFNYWDHPEQFTIDKIAKNIGIPAEIKVAEQQGEGYQILFMYPKKNLLIIIHGKRIFARPADQLPFDICIENRDHQAIESWFLSNDEYTNAVNNRYSSMYGGWLNWSKALGVSVEDLFQQLQQPGKCIPSP